MRIQNVNNNKQNHKQNFRALVIKGDVAKDKQLLFDLGDLLSTRLVGGTTKHGKDVLILDSIPKSKDEDKLLYLIKDMFEKNAVRRHKDSSVEKMKAAYLKKYPDGLQIE